MNNWLIDLLALLYLVMAGVTGGMASYCFCNERYFDAAKEIATYIIAFLWPLTFLPLLGEYLIQRKKDKEFRWLLDNIDKIQEIEKKIKEIK